MRDRQRDVIYEELLHVDFLEISLKELLRATVAIELVGEAPPVSKLGDVIINHVLTDLDIEALPMDLPERIEVDISGIETVEDTITVADLNLGEKITIHTPEDEVIVTVGFVAAEVEGEEDEMAEGSAEPEVISAREAEDEE